jgi:hypothetical protein
VAWPPTSAPTSRQHPRWPAQTLSPTPHPSPGIQERCLVPHQPLLDGGAAGAGAGHPGLHVRAGGGGHCAGAGPHGGAGAAAACCWVGQAGVGGVACHRAKRCNEEHNRCLACSGTTQTCARQHLRPPLPQVRAAIDKAPHEASAAAALRLIDAPLHRDQAIKLTARLHEAAAQQPAGARLADEAGLACVWRASLQRLLRDPDAEPAARVRRVPLAKYVAALERERARREAQLQRKERLAGLLVGARSLGAPAGEALAAAQAWAGALLGLPQSVEEEDTRQGSGGDAAVKAQPQGGLNALAGERPTVALLTLTGPINLGPSASPSLGGDSNDKIASLPVVKALQAVRRDDAVRAVVLRIDSPGACLAQHSAPPASRAPPSPRSCNGSRLAPPQGDAAPARLSWPDCPGRPPPLPSCPVPCRRLRRRLRGHPPRGVPAGGGGQAGGGVHGQRGGQRWVGGCVGVCGGGGPMQSGPAACWQQPAILRWRMLGCSCAACASPSTLRWLLHLRPRKQDCSPAGHHHRQHRRPHRFVGAKGGRCAGGCGRGVRGGGWRRVGSRMPAGGSAMCRAFLPADRSTPPPAGPSRQAGGGRGSAPAGRARGGEPGGAQRRRAVSPGALHPRPAPPGGGARRRHLRAVQAGGGVGVDAWGWGPTRLLLQPPSGFAFAARRPEPSCHTRTLLCCLSTSSRPFLPRSGWPRGAA